MPFAFQIFSTYQSFSPGPHAFLQKPMLNITLQGESASAFCHWFGDPSSLFVFVAWWLLAAQVDEGIAGSSHRLPLALGGSRSCSSDDGSTGDESGIEQISSQTRGCTTGGIQLCLWFARQKSGKDGSAEGGEGCLMLFVFLGLGWETTPVQHLGKRHAIQYLLSMSGSVFKHPWQFERVYIDLLPRIMVFGCFWTNYDIS